MTFYSQLQTITDCSYNYCHVQINLDIIKLKTTLHSNATKSEEEDKKELEGRTDKAGHSIRLTDSPPTATDREQSPIAKLNITPC